ncbi:hypothetical protein F0562_009808 [Nyssa sinensis]|uniref:Uncharacterized protein n=1 Tax=Nyssa sinensis TaxID=561372 RepID=A0A5J4ZX56_9ASTE|nr:hypothetical protein F0562_009808 [Nyssa sinensis]
MSEIESSNNGGRPTPAQNLDTQNMLSTQPFIRKRLASSSTSELQEESLIQGETSSDVAAPVPKKSRGSDFPQEGAEGQSDALSENLEILPAIEESLEAVGDLPQGSSEDAIDAERDEIEPTGEQAEPPKVDGTNQVELCCDRSEVLEEILDKPRGTEVMFDEVSKVQEQDIQQSMVESGSEREEGELVPDITDQEDGGTMSNIAENPESEEAQPEPVAASVGSPGVEEEALVAGTVEINPPEDQAVVETEQIPEAVIGDAEGSKQVSPVGKSSTTINLQERAKQRSKLRQAGVLSSSLGRGRGRVARGQGARGGRSGRGQSSGEQDEYRL